jgi:hypothetical protein
MPLRTSAHWAAARDTAALAGDGRLTARLDALEASAGDVEFEFGRGHGDWVEWNLATLDRELYAWDWAHSAPTAPFGLDVLHHPYLRYRVVGGLDAETSARRALADAASSLHDLGVGPDLHAPLVALLQLELDLREVRAEQRRAASAVGEPRPS